MKFLETRTEIAKAINFKQYPTIRIDVSFIHELSNLFIGSTIKDRSGYFDT